MGIFACSLMQGSLACQHTFCSVYDRSPLMGDGEIVDGRPIYRTEMIVMTHPENHSIKVMMLQLQQRPMATMNRRNLGAKCARDRTLLGRICVCMHHAAGSFFSLYQGDEMG